jgi:dipeptidase
MVSDHLIDYAVERGWYDPQHDGTFNYKEAYGRPKWTGWFEDKYNKDPRQFRGQWLLTGREPDLSREGHLPFSVKPKKKITLESLRSIMSDHMEGTRFDQTNQYKKGSPHDLMGPTDGAICDQRNQEVAIFQLRDWMPPAIGCVYWRSTAALCSGVLTPWYAGITHTPPCYQANPGTRKNNITQYHFDPPPSIYQYDPDKAFWTFNTLENLVDINYRKSVDTIRSVWSRFEREERTLQEPVEEKALELYREDREKARLYLTRYCNGLALEARGIAATWINKLREKNFGY